MSEQGGWLRAALWILVAATPVVALLYMRATYRPPDLANYDLIWEAPKGWREVPRSSVSIFRYKHPGAESYITGSVQKTTSETPILPELDTEGIVEYSLATARQKQPQWKVDRMPDVEGGTQRFSVMRKRQPGRTMLQAYCVKGASTVILTLSYRGDDPALMDSLGQDFSQFLRGLKLEKQLSGSEGFGPTDDF